MYSAFQGKWLEFASLSPNEPKRGTARSVAQIFVYFIGVAGNFNHTRLYFGKNWIFRIFDDRIHVNVHLNTP